MDGKKLKKFEVRFTAAQLETLQKEAEEGGFESVSAYLRYHLFVTLPAVERMNRIYEKVK